MGDRGLFPVPPSLIRTTWNRSAAREGLRVENRSADETKVLLYDEIGFFGVTAGDFVRELAGIRTGTIDLHINSPGGDVFDGLGIYNALRQHTSKVNITVDGIAASIASVIAMAGDSVAMAKGSMMMIHEPFALVIGDARDMRKQADALDLMGESIAGIYAERTKADAATWRAAMAEETWYSDSEAVSAGLADSLLNAQPAVKNQFDLSIFRHAPGGSAAAAASTVENKPEPVKPDWRQAARFRVAAAQLGAIDVHVA